MSKTYDISALNKALTQTDWCLLRDQKARLNEITDHGDEELLEGLVSFLDAIQDAVIADDILTREQVFGECECQNCGATWFQSELKPIEHLFERVSPGEIMPAGECPDCGALCHIVKEGDR